MTRRILFVVVFACHASPLFAAKPKIVSVEKIWDRGKHNAFTDLIRWHDKWYCTFREADAHVGGDGKLRVLESANGQKWESAALVAERGIDLRDPKISVTPDDRLMMVAGGSIYKGKTFKGMQPRVTFSKDGHTWTAPERVLAEGEWLWRVTWHGGTAYGVAYGRDSKLKLYASPDGVKYALVTILDVPGEPNETTLCFLPSGEMIALVRRDGKEGNAYIGRSKHPYKEWSWIETKHRVGGPNFIRLPNGSLWAGGRSYPGGAKTVLARMTLEGEYEPVLTLPSGGDTSYPGLAWHDGLLWISYYSSHEGKKSAIYLAKVRLPEEPLPKILASHFSPPAEYAGQLGDYKSPLRFADGTEVKTPEDWQRRRKEILKTWHGLMGNWPKRLTKPKVEVIRKEHIENYTRQHIRLEIAPGRITEDAYLLVPDGKGPFPAMVVVFYDAATGVGLGKKTMRDFARQLTSRGFVTLSLGSAPETYYPNKETCKLQPLSYRCLYREQLPHGTGQSVRCGWQTHWHCWAFLRWQVGDVR